MKKAIMENKIEAAGLPLTDILKSGEKYIIDYFQREYKWKKEHIKQMVTDLTFVFLTQYKPGDKRTQVKSYNNYFLGAFVVSEKEDGLLSIIDGQQRLISLTLFLIYLKHRCEDMETDSDDINDIKNMVSSRRHGKRTFNIDEEKYSDFFKSLLESEEYNIGEKDSESIQNMAECYQHIGESFPEEINEKAMPYFVDWLRDNVIMVKIKTYSDENAYTIFETMNGRGLNLSQSEMLKGFLLSKIDSEDREKSNDLWKEEIQKLHKLAPDEEQLFFQAWLRSQYADTIRPGGRGAKNEDFENIGTRFHGWVRGNHKDKMKLNYDNEFKNFVDKNFTFYIEVYRKILAAQKEWEKDLEHVFYTHRRGLATSLRAPLMLAPITVKDTNNVIREKVNLVARFIETYTVRRLVNSRSVSYAPIRYTMCSLVKNIRGKNVNQLREILSQELKNMDDTFGGMKDFSLSDGGQNGRFIKFLLSRITAFIEEKSEMNTSFVTYHEPPQGKPFEIEHILGDIWGKRSSYLKEEFDSKEEFDKHRQRIGNLILLPEGINRSIGNKLFNEKLKDYFAQNLLASSLCKDYYEGKPGFKRFREGYDLPFKNYLNSEDPTEDLTEKFKKADIAARAELYQAICEIIWNNKLTDK